MRSRRTMLLAGLLSAVTLGAGAAVAAPRPPEPPSVSMLYEPRDMTVEAPGDTLVFVLMWTPSVDKRGAADGYEVVVTDSAANAAVHQAMVTGTADTIRIPAPDWGQTRTMLASVTAHRRGRTSAPARTSWVIVSPDADPPAPDSVYVDTLSVSSTTLDVGQVAMVSVPTTATSGWHWLLADDAVPSMLDLQREAQARDSTSRQRPLGAYSVVSYACPVSDQVCGNLDNLRVVGVVGLRPGTQTIGIRMADGTYRAAKMTVRGGTPAQASPFHNTSNAAP